MTATVAGKNFTAPNIIENSFAVSCVSNTSVAEESKVRIATDSRLKITLKIHGTVGEYAVKITNDGTSTFHLKKETKAQARRLSQATQTEATTGMFFVLLTILEQHMQKKTILHTIFLAHTVQLTLIN